MVGRRPSFLAIRSRAAVDDLGSRLRQTIPLDILIGAFVWSLSGREESAMPRRIYCSSIFLFVVWSIVVLAQEPAKKDVPSREELIKKLEADLTNVKLTGRFTVAGREDREPRAEEYTITSAIKLPEGDMWLINSRIKYGDKDTTLPIPLEIKWAGDTPVITLTDLAIPGLGTFTSRVVLYDNRYAGTWQHGKVGGHLFGRIEKVKDEKAETK
jgi:hypothetical protein